MSKTGVINRAIRLYHFITQETWDGSTLVIRRPDGKSDRSNCCDLLMWELLLGNEQSESVSEFRRG
jgi:hypothetical protein